MCLVEWHPTSPFVYRGALTDVCMHMYTCPLSAIRSRSFAPTAGPGQPLHQQHGNCTGSSQCLPPPPLSLPLSLSSLFLSLPHTPSPLSSHPTPSPYHSFPSLYPPLPPPTTPSPSLSPPSLLPPPPSPSLSPPPLLPPPPFPSLSPPPSPPSPHIGAHGEVSLMDVGRRSVSGPHLLL